MVNDFITPKILKESAEKIWQRGDLHRAYVEKNNLFPLKIPLARLSAKVLLNEFSMLQQAINVLQKDSQKYSYQINYHSINHRLLGEQKIPIAIIFSDEIILLSYLAKTQDFLLFKTTVDKTLQTHPILQNWLVRYPFKLMNFIDNWDKLLSVCNYFIAYPQPNCYLRQLDIVGIDSKFIEQHKTILSELLDQILPETARDITVTGLSYHGFERRYGLRYELPQIRLRILDKNIAIYGLTDLMLTVSEFKQLTLPITTVFITENKMNGLAFPDFNQAIVIFGLGYAVDLLAQARCLQTTQIYYWGDLDTHGFAILSRLRGYFPATQSLLMDMQTLQTFEHLWVQEPESNTFMSELPNLTKDEQRVFDWLKQRPRHHKIRLEQERISYHVLLNALNSINAFKLSSNLG